MSQTGKIKRIAICLSLSVLLAAQVSAFQEDEKAAMDSKSLASLKKSLFLPGWGQFAEKHTVEGIAFLTAEIFCVYKVLSNNRKGNENYELYKEAVGIDDAVRFRDLTETYDRRRNLYMLAAFGVWAVNLIDIYVIVKNHEKKKDTLSIKLEHGENARLAFSITFRF